MSITCDRQPGEQLGVRLENDTLRLVGAVPGRWAVGRAGGRFHDPAASRAAPGPSPGEAPSGHGKAGGSVRGARDQ